MKYRHHRGSLEDSMATCRTLEWIGDLYEAIMEAVDFTNAPLTLEQFKKTVSVAPYGTGPDDRIQWPATYVVTLKDLGVFGFCSGPIESLPLEKPRPNIYSYYDYSSNEPLVGRIFAKDILQADGILERTTGRKAQHLSCSSGVRIVLVDTDKIKRQYIRRGMYPKDNEVIYTSGVVYTTPTLRDELAVLRLLEKQREYFVHSRALAFYEYPSMIAKMERQRIWSVADEIHKWTKVTPRISIPPLRRPS